MSYIDLFNEKYGDFTKLVVSGLSSSLLAVDSTGTVIASTISTPLIYSVGGLSLLYSGNLKITGSSLDTIQDIKTSSTPTFSNLILSSQTANGIICGGTSSSSALQNIGVGVSGQYIKSTGELPTWATGSILSGVNDTNVTLTLGGSPTTALLASTSITLGWSGVLAVTRGGTGTSTVFTAGSVIFADASGVYSQDNSNFFWDDTNNRLGLGTASPSQQLHINGSNTSQVLISNTTTATTNSFKASPLLQLTGTIWNSALGSQTMRGGLQMGASSTNTNPSISKMSFLVSTDNAASPTEAMYLTSQPVLNVLGGCNFLGSSLSSNNSVYIQNTAAATSGIPQSSNILGVLGKSWSSSSGNGTTTGYLQMINITNNTNPTVDRLAFFTGSAGVTATERFCITTQGRLGIGTMAPDAVLHAVGTVILGGDDGGLGYSNSQVSVTDGNTASSSLGQTSIFSLVRGQTGSSWPQIATMTLGRWTTTSAPAPQTRLDFNLKNSSNGTDVADVTVMTMQSDGNVGINTTGPDRKLDILDASNPQLRLTYTDGSVYTDFQTTSTGYLNIFPSGGGVSSAAISRPFTVSAGGSSTDGFGIALFDSGLSPSAGNLFGIGVNKSGTDRIMFGINKNTATYGIPSNACYISSYGTGSTITIGRGAGDNLPGFADICISSTGNVGIGTTSPNCPLEVYKSTAGVQELLRLHNPSTNVSATTDLNLRLGTSGTTTGFISNGWNGSQMYLSIGAGSPASETIRILGSSKFVGINKTVPTSPLHVAGATTYVAQFDNTTTGPSVNALIGLQESRSIIGYYAVSPYSGQSATVVYAGSGKYVDIASADRDITFNTTLTERMRISSNGGVCVNTTNPLDILTINNACVITSSTIPTAGYLRILSVGNNNYIQSGLTNAVGSAAPLLFTSVFGVDEWMRITSTGNVGIGTGATVSAKLHSLATTEQLRIGYDASNYTSFTTDSTGNLIIDPTGTRTQIKSEAVDLGYGNSGTTKLVEITNNTSDAIIYMYNSAQTVNVVFRANGDSYFNGGNLGVGTSTVNARLHSLATTEQLRLGYSAVVYSSLTTNSSGYLTLLTSGSRFGIGVTPNYNFDISYDPGAGNYLCNFYASGAGFSRQVLRLAGGNNDSAFKILSMYSANATREVHFNLDFGQFFINADSYRWANVANTTTYMTLSNTGVLSGATWQGSVVGVTYGGTGASLTAINGGIVYSTGSAMAISAAGTAGQVLQSNGASAPTWTNLSTIGVSSITGTANQISASVSTGAVTLSLSPTCVTPGSLETTGNFGVGNAAVPYICSCLRGTITTPYTNIFGTYVSSNFWPTASINQAYGLYNACTYKAAATFSISTVYGEYIFNSVAGNAGTISNIYGLFVDTGSGGGGAIGNAYGAYILGPNHGTNRVALYTDSLLVSYDTRATSGGTTTLSNQNKTNQYFTGSASQTVNLPVASTLFLGYTFHIHNRTSAGTLTVNTSAGAGNQVASVVAGQSITVRCIIASGTSTASWDCLYDGGYAGFAASNVVGTLAVANGGTGVSSWSNTYALLCSGTTSTDTVKPLTSGILGQVLTSAGSGANPTWTTINTLSSGSTTPTAANNLNLSSVSAQPMLYSRNGDIVTCTGSVDCTPSASNTWSLTLTLPVARSSNFVNGYDASGVATSFYSTTNTVINGVITAKTSSQTVYIFMCTTTNTTNAFTIRYSFQYTLV